MRFSHPMVKLKELLTPIDREEVPQSGVVYRQIGVKWWGKGAYEREAVDGGDTKYNKFNQIIKDDVVINKIWARHGSVCVIPKKLDGCYVSTEFPIFLINKEKLSPHWFHTITQMKFFWSACDKFSSGTSGKNRIKPGMFLEIEIPLPAIEEQEKLVGLINSYSDQLNIISTHREKALNDYHHLKNSILQEAVQGRLVPQDPKDESANVLLENIKAEKEQLIKDKIIKKEKPLPEITEEEIPYELPKGWYWVRLASISTKLGAGSTPTGGKNVYSDKGIKFIRSQNVWNDGLRIVDIACITDELNNKMQGSIVKANDILLNITGASIGRSCVVVREFDTANVNQHVSIIRLVDPTMNTFIHKCIISPYIQSLIMDVQVGVSREGLSMDKLGKFLIPIPPLNEQKRIVEKVDQLMALCDELEKTVEQSKQDSEMLMQSVLQEAFQSA